MFKTPFQHGVVHEITKHGRFDPANPQFQNYAYAARDLNELVDAKVIQYAPKLNLYTPGTKWSER